MWTGRVAQRENHLSPGPVGGQDGGTAHAGVVLSGQANGDALLGLGVYLFTGDLLRSITILIVFCPCVMVLATPTALVASIGNAALRGSLVKKGATIERLASVDTISSPRPYCWKA